MGCGISKIDPEEAAGRPKRSHKFNHRAILRDHHGHVDETDYVERDNYYNEKGHSKNSSFYHRDDHITYPPSPSFREYCVDSGSSNDENGGKDENGSHGERASNVEKVDLAEQVRPLNSEKTHGSRSPEMHMKNKRKGIRNAIQKPAGWIGKSKK